MHWSSEHIAFLRRVIPEISGTPIYILRNDEHPCEWDPNWMASFSPLADLKAQTTLEQLDLWAGRGVAITVRSDFQSWSNRVQVGTTLHELGHGIEWLAEPNALTTELTPIAREWLEVGESKMLHDAGIIRDANMMKKQHGPHFVRLCCHLHWRARQQMIIAASDIQFLHEIYSLGSERYNDVTEALSSELARSRNLNLLKLREPPAAFTELFA